MIYCKSLGKSYETKELMFADLVKHEQAIINVKTSEIFKSCEKGHPSVKFLTGDRLKDVADKAGFTVEEGFIYPVISSCNWFDSHRDVHFKGCFTRTVKEQQGQVYYALDHELKFNSIIAWQKDVEMFTADIPWQWVGKDYDGNTHALVFKIAKDAVRIPAVLEAIENKDSEFENSIRMRYIKVKMGINSSAKDYAVQKAYYDSKISEIANRKEVEEEGYFFGIEELAIYKEGSLVVAGGSNSATSIIISETGDTSDSDENKSKDENPNEAVQLEAKSKSKKDQLIKVLHQLH